jgi:hypothetical protein
LKTQLFYVLLITNKFSISQEKIKKIKRNIMKTQLFSLSISF